MTDSVEQLKKEIDEAIISLTKAGEVTAAVNINNHFRKVLILSAGSFLNTGSLNCYASLLAPHRTVTNVWKSF